MDPGLIQELAAPAIAIAVPMIVGAIRWASGMLPKWSLPVLAGALGPALDMAIAASAGTEGHGALAVVYGLAGVGVRELRHQLGPELQRALNGRSGGPQA